LEIVSYLTCNQLPLLGTWQDRKVLLLELPHSHVPPGTENLIKWLIDHDYQPLIAHPERNRDILADYKKLTSLEKAGCLFQVTAGAFNGRFSEKIQLMAERLLNDGVIAVIASDSHNIDRRPNDMRLCFDRLTESNDSETILDLMLHNPKLITQTLSWSLDT
jgi:protein-tyrosine phosphatase